MQTSPTWLSPSQRTLTSHIALSADDVVEDPEFFYCSFLEPISRVFTWNQVTEISLTSNEWKFDSWQENLSWRETVCKVGLFFFMSFITAPVKFFYMRKIQEILSRIQLAKLEKELHAIREKNDPHQLMLLKMEIVAEKLRFASERERVVIVDGEEVFSCKTHYDFKQQYVPDVILAHIDTEKRQNENRETLEFFFNSFGKERAERLFKMVGIDPVYHFEHKLGLNRKHIATFLALTAFVHIEDMRHLYQELERCKKEGVGYLYLSEKEIIQIVDKFENKAFDELNKEQYDLLWDIMVPLPLSTMFVDKLDRDEPDQERGSSVGSIIQGLYVEEGHLRSRPNMPQRDFEYTLAKSLVGGFKENSDASIEGRVIRQKKGYGFVHPMIRAAGCYCLPIEAMGATRRDQRLEKKNEEGMYRYDSYLSRFVFLPMQTFANYLPEKWESMAGAIHENIGVKGALAIKARLEKFQKKKAFEKVDLFGISMGGVQLAKLLTAWMKLEKPWVRKATMICAPAVHETVAKHFAQIVEEKKSKAVEGEYLIKLRCMWQWGDCVQSLGDMELATDAIHADIHRVKQGNSSLVKLKIFWYHKSQEKEFFNHHTPLKQKAPTYLIGTIYQGFLAMMGPHRDDIVVDGQYGVYSVSSVKEKNAITEYLDNRALGWEQIRRMLIQNFPTTTSPSHFIDAIK